MLTNVVQEQISELRWLIDELGHELDALVITPYPRIHHFLMLNLATRTVQVAMRIRDVLAERPQEKQGLSNEVRLLERPA